MARLRSQRVLYRVAVTKPSRRLPLGCRPAGGDQCLSGRTQCQPQTLRLD